MDDTFAIDGGREKTAWQKRSAASKIRGPRVSQYKGGGRKKQSPGIKLASVPTYMTDDLKFRISQRAMVNGISVSQQICALCEHGLTVNCSRP